MCVQHFILALLEYRKLLSLTLFSMSAFGKPYQNLSYSFIYLRMNEPTSLCGLKTLCYFYLLCEFTCYLTRENSIMYVHASCQRPEV